MFRTLAQVANATPPDYLNHAPHDPIVLAHQMVAKARRLYPIVEADDGVSRMQGYDFLYIGPGSGLIIKVLLEQGQRAQAIETSRRGIASAPEEVRNYILWGKPWELPIPMNRNVQTIKDGQVVTATQPFKMYHLGILNKYLKEILTPEEWNSAVKEIKKVCQAAYVL